MILGRIFEWQATWERKERWSSYVSRPRSHRKRNLKQKFKEVQKKKKGPKIRMSQHHQQGTNSKIVGTSKLYIPSHFRYSSSRCEIIQKTATTNVFYIFVWRGKTVMLIWWGKYSDINFLFCEGRTMLPIFCFVRKRRWCPWCGLL